MDLVQQISGATKYNRYPEIFKEIKRIVLSDLGDDLNILSFGCSSGEEPNTLSNLYFFKSYIDGYDINDSTIRLLKNYNNNQRVRYYCDKKYLGKYDLCFCMSVLCRWPYDKNYTFEMFDNALKEIDGNILEGGYICLFNTTYLFTDSSISHKYLIVDVAYNESQYVVKRNKDGKLYRGNFPYILFKKISS